jgi:hypothetical protein
MMAVFVGGSRAVSRLSSIIREQIDDLIAKNCAFYIGDANGADKAVQQHLADRKYPHVTVFCTEECRNNLGDWSVGVIAPKQFYTVSSEDELRDLMGRSGLQVAGYRQASLRV